MFRVVGIVQRACPAAALRYADTQLGDQRKADTFGSYGKDGVETRYSRHRTPCGVVVFCFRGETRKKVEIWHTIALLGHAKIVHVSKMALLGHTAYTIETSRIH